MPVSVVGMHRSGTSLVTKLLRICGFDLGPEADLVPANASNTDGYWEHRGIQELNDEILARHGGGWDFPPNFAPDWQNAATLAPVRAAAVAIIGRFQEPWAWKDPRTSLTLPFWQSLLPGMQHLVCVRNPLEVALSLNQRGACSFPFALNLWQDYTESILRSTTPATRVVTHYGAYLHDVEAEISRVLTALGKTVCNEALAKCRESYKPELRHTRMSLRQLRELGMPKTILEPYMLLCDEAQHNDGDAAAGHSLAPQSADWFRLCVGEYGRSVADRESAAAERWKQDLAERDETLQALLEDLRSVHEAALPPKQLAYRQTVRRLRDLVKAHVRSGAIVAVVSKGDDDLLKFRNVCGWHFPQSETGTYAGYYPAASLAAIAHLERLRARGATHFLIPDTSLWWLTTYPEFREHLERRYAVVARQDGVGMLYSLAAKPEPAIDLVGRFTAAFGRPPQVLDWNVGEGVVSRAFTRATVFAPPSANGTLPYVDRSVEIVAVNARKPEMLAEAKRVAEVAVVDFSDGGRIDWLCDLPMPTLPRVSIVIPVCNHWPVTEACLGALWSTLPADADVEILIIDDASRDETAVRLAAMAKVEPRLKILVNAVNAGFVDSCNAGAKAATGEYLLFLNNDTVPLPGWLPPLVKTFELFPDCGAVGGKLLFPDGRLQEAGGIIFADASAAHFGRNEPNAMLPLFNYVRPVDYCSAALMLTPRQLFLDLGGFDSDFRPGYYEDTDYCFRLRERGHGVYYQPESVVVHLEGATAGTDTGRGMKRHQEINRRRFQQRHAAALAEQRSRPQQFDDDVWKKLAYRGKSPVMS